MDPPAAGPLAQPHAWDLVADAYAEEIIPLFELFAERALALADVGPRSRVLEVAAGPGTLSVLAAERAAEVVAVDFSPEMIARLSRRIAGRGLRSVHAFLEMGKRSIRRTPGSTPPSRCSASSSFPTRAAGSPSCLAYSRQAAASSCRAGRRWIGTD